MKISKMEGPEVETAIVEESRTNPALPKKRGQSCDTHHMWSELLARNVRHFRRMKNISQATLAQECGIFRTYLSRIESGKCNPSLSVMVALADALDMPPYALFVPIE